MAQRPVLRRHAPSTTILQALAGRPRPGVRPVPADHNPSYLVVTKRLILSTDVAGVNIKTMGSRTSYHHGDLRNALIDAAARLAERGGPDAVTIRAAAREVGVTPTAAYRHFTGHQSLLEAVRSATLARMCAAMRKRLASLPDQPDPVEAAFARLQALGQGYVDYALAEPGLFRTAFYDGAPVSELIDPANQNDPNNQNDPDNPHRMLVELIDELVRLGVLPAEQRLDAEMGAWSIAHGLAMLLIDGPPAAIPAAERATVVENTLTTFTHTFWKTGSHIESSTPPAPRSTVR
jgi:AcrR family transcriptional regulator